MSDGSFVSAPPVSPLFRPARPQELALLSEQEWQALLWPTENTAPGRPAEPVRAQPMPSLARQGSGS